MKKVITVIFILFWAVTCATYCQFAVGYNTDGNTLCISTNPLHRFSGEFRVNTKEYNQSSWSYSDRGITQAYVIFNLFSSQNASLYCGTGLGVNLLSEESNKWLSINIPVGLKLSPFTKLPNLLIIGEYDPMIITSESTPIIHSISLGFRYILSNKE